MSLPFTYAQLEAYGPALRWKIGTWVQALGGPPNDNELYFGSPYTTQSLAGYELVKAVIALTALIERHNAESKNDLKGVIGTDDFRQLKSKFKELKDLDQYSKPQIQEYLRGVQSLDRKQKIARAQWWVPAPWDPNDVDPKPEPCPGEELIKLINRYAVLPEYNFEHRADVEQRFKNAKRELEKVQVPAIESALLILRSGV